MSVKQNNKQSGRTYTTPIGELPSVTTILKELDASALKFWAIKMTTQYLEDHLKSGGEITLKNYQQLFASARGNHSRFAGDAAEIGSQVHHMIERHIGGEKVVTKGVDGKARNAYNSFIGWEQKVRPKWLESELVVFSEDGFAGTLDGVARINRELWIIDFKTSKQVYKPNMPMQLAAYAKAYSERSGEKISGGAILRVRKEAGKNALITKFSREKLYHYYKMFNHLLKFSQLKGE